MPFLDFDRVNTLLAAQITRDAAALVAMLEVQTTELKEIRDILGRWWWRGHKPATRSR